MTPLPRKTVSLQGQTLSYVDAGEGPVLLLGHGLLWSAEVWAPLLDQLTPFFRCVAPDLWGHGQSEGFPGNPDTVSIEALTYGMEGFVDALALDIFSLLGLSLGGMWAVQLAHRRREQIERLVLLSTDAGPEPPEFAEGALAMLRQVDVAEGFTEPILDTLSPLYFADRTLENNPELAERFRETLRTWPPETVHSVCAMGRGAFLRRDQLPLLQQIPCPTLVIAGAGDKVRTLSEAQRMVSLLPKGEICLLPDAGHVAPLEQPGPLAARLLDFLRPASETVSCPA